MLDMLLCICKPESISSGKLITQRDLLPEFQEQVLDIPLPPSLQHRFTRDTWMALIQRGRYDTWTCNLTVSPCFSSERDEGGLEVS